MRAGGTPSGRSADDQRYAGGRGAGDRFVDDSYAEDFHDGGAHGVGARPGRAPGGGRSPEGPYGETRYPEASGPYPEAEYGDRGGSGYAEPEYPASAVRPFLLTAGRVAGGDGLVPPLPVETQVVATSSGVAALDTFAFEHRDIVAVCQEPQSLAEIAAKLRMHLNVIRVLADDLCVDGQLSLYLPQGNPARDASVLRRVIDGLRAVLDSRGARHDL